MANSQLYYQRIGRALNREAARGLSIANNTTQLLECIESADLPNEEREAMINLAIAVKFDAEDQQKGLRGAAQMISDIPLLHKDK